MSKHHKAQQPTPEQTLADMVSSLPKELQDKARQQLAKLQSQANKVKEAEAYKQFNTALQPKLIDLVKQVADECGVNLDGRKIVVTSANGTEPTYSHTPIRGKGNGNRQGFPSSWGKATYNGKEYKSPSELANTLGLQINGRRDMVDVFTHDGKYTVDAVKGDHFIVTDRDGS